MGRRIGQILLLLLSLVLLAYGALLAFASTGDDGDIGTTAECSDRYRLAGLGLVVLAGGAVALAVTVGGHRGWSRRALRTLVLVTVLPIVVGSWLLVVGIRTDCLPDVPSR